MTQAKKLTPSAIVPTKGTPGAAGFDLYADEDNQIRPGERKLIQTNIAMAIPEGRVGLIWPRSGLAVKHGIDVLAGVIDSDYRGPIGVCLINHGNDLFVIRKGDRIAQMLIQPVEGEMVEVKQLDATERGCGGYGSTGR